MAELRTIGVIGAGQMGAGIAQVLAMAGYAVRVHDIDATRIDRARALVRSGLEKLAAKGKIESAAVALARISAAPDMNELKACDLIVEAASEDEKIKTSIYASLRGVLPPHTYIGSNTSSLSITRLAAATDRPD